MIQLESLSSPVVAMRVPQLLIATCKMDDSAFKKGVVLLYKHDASGSQGLVINQPLDANLGTVLEQLEIKTSLPTVLNKTLFLGGPVERSQGMILSMSADTDHNIDINGRQKGLEEIAKGCGPKDYLVALGYAAWEPDQLQEEINEGYWVQRPVDRSLLFDIPVQDRWMVASSQMGFDMRTMTNFAGHG
jgi:putative transcriptional regulator